MGALHRFSKTDSINSGKTGKVSAVCTYCKSELQEEKKSNSQKEIIPDAFKCSSCGRKFSKIWNVPYMGIIEEEDILSLIEITAVMKDYDLENIEPLRFHSIVEAVRKFGDTGDVSVLKRGLKTDTLPSWINNRINEQMQFSFMTSGIDFRNKTLLDIGAGTGFDSFRFSLAGAKVHSFEFNPILTAVGKITNPGSEWICGTSKNLPYPDESFDFAAINAALHHFSDIPAAVSEALRILKTGGILFTTSDPFAADNSDEYKEAKLFNSHPDVLSGINESKPHFSEIMKTLVLFRDNLEIKIFTETAYPSCDFPKEWSIDEALKILPKNTGSISILIKKISKTVIPASKAGNSILEMAEFSENMKTAPKKAFEKLADLIPGKYLNKGILSSEHPKFMLLNGWQMLGAGSNVRSAYKRGRLFYSPEQLKYSSLSLSTFIPYHLNSDTPDFIIKINGELIYKKKCMRGIWHNVQVELNKLKLNREKPFFLELLIKTSKDSFSENIFLCTNPLFSEENKEIQEIHGIGHSEIGFSSLIELGALNKNRITVLASPDFYSFSASFIEKTHSFNEIDIICSEDQVYLYQWMRKVKIVDTYPNFLLNKRKFKKWKAKETPDIIMTGEYSGAELFRKSFSDSERGRIFLADRDGKAILFSHFHRKKLHIRIIKFIARMVRKFMEKN